MKVDIGGLRKLIAAATQPGPWSTDKSNKSNVLVHDAHGMWVAECGDAPDDAELIAAGRDALPAALDEIQFLREKVIYAATALRDMKTWVERCGKASGLAPNYVQTLLDGITAEIKNLERTGP